MFFTLGFFPLSKREKIEDLVAQIRETLDKRAEEIQADDSYEFARIMWALEDIEDAIERSYDVDEESLDIPRETLVDRGQKLTASWRMTAGIAGGIPSTPSSTSSKSRVAFPSPPVMRRARCQGKDRARRAR